MRLTSQAAIFFSIVVTVAASNELSIEPNLGQSGPEVRYLARTPHGAVFFLDHELVFRSAGEVRFAMVGAKLPTQFEAREPQARMTSYSVGRDQSKWAHDVPSYSRLVQHDIYQGVDAIYYGSAAGLEYDFVVAPHSDPRQIRFAIHGVDRVQIDAKGDLLMRTPGGLMRQRRPRLYQVSANGEIQSVTGGFRLLGRSTIGFTIGRYDRSRPLTIDPVIESSTYLGGSGDDAIVASNGTMSVGTTTSVDFPASSGQHQGRDIVITGLSDGYSHIYGGSGDDIVTAVYMPDQGQFQNRFDALVIVGYTDSPDLPTDISYNRLIPLSLATNAAWQRDYGGGASDAFVLAIVNQPTFNSSFRPFLSYMGGTGSDRATGVFAIPNSFHFEIIGSTDQPGFPLPGAVKTAGPGGGVDGFMAEGTFFSGAELFGVNYFGGSGDDRPLGVYLDPNGLVITGETTSSDFPMVNPLNNVTSGGKHAFVLTGTSSFSGPDVLASAVFGASGDDRGKQVRRLPNGNIVVGGVTSSVDFPVLNAVQSTFGGGASDAFITQFSPDLSSLVSSTYYGGSGADELTALASDPFGNFFAAGFTSSADFPLKNPVQAAYGGGLDDAFLLHFQAGGDLQQATYLGGSGSDRILGLFTSGDMSVIATGQTSSTDFPIVKAPQPRLAGNTNGFITRVSTNLIGVAEPLLSGKDLRANYASMTVGPINGISSADVLVTSSDPSSVAVAGTFDGMGAGSATLPGGYAIRQFFFDCLTDQGGADLTFSAPGYPDRVAHVECYPATLQLLYGPGYQGPYDYKVPIGFPTQLEAYLGASRPDHSAVNTHVSLRPGVDPNISGVLSSSNPSVATVSAADVVFPALANSVYVGTLTAVAAGDTDLTLTSSVTISQPLHVHVTSPIARAGLQAPQIPAGFSCQLNAPIDVPMLGTPVVVKVTSQNPDLVLLTDDPRVAGQASKTVTAIYGSVDTYVQAVGPEGQATLILSMDGFDPVTVPVTVARPVAYLSYTRGLQLRTGEEASISVPIVPPTGPPICGSNVQGSLLATISNSNPGAFAAPATVDLSTLPGNTASFTVTAIGEGTATISIQPPDGFIFIAPGSLTFSVHAKAGQ